MNLGHAPKGPGRLSEGCLHAQALSGWGTLDPALGRPEGPHAGFPKGAAMVSAGGIVTARSGRTPVRRLHVDALLKKCNLRSIGTPGTRELQYISTIPRNRTCVGNASFWEHKTLTPSAIPVPNADLFPNGNAGTGTTPSPSAPTSRPRRQGITLPPLRHPTHCGVAAVPDAAIQQAD